MVGSAIYRIEDKVIGTVDIVATETIEAAGLSDYMGKVFQQFLL